MEGGVFENTFVGAEEREELLLDTEEASDEKCDCFSFRVGVEICEVDFSRLAVELGRDENNLEKKPIVNVWELSRVRIARVERG